MRTAICLVLAVITTPAQAVTGFCQDLRFMVRWTAHDPSQGSGGDLRLPDRPAVFRQCRANIQGFTNERTCIVPLDSGLPTVESLALETTRCLPGAERMDSPGASARGEILLLFRSLAIRIGQEPSPSGTSGRQARIIVAVPEG